MFHKLLSISALLLCAHGWALHCSSAKIISDQKLDASYAHISSNEKGDVILTWISTQGRNERLEATYMTQNSLWSFPTPLSNWEERIYPQYCLANAKGDLFVTWETKTKDDYLLHIAEKIGENPWNFHVNRISSLADFILSDKRFDSAGNLICIGSKTVPYTPESSSKYAYKNTIPAVVISIKSPAQIEQKLDISPPDGACNYISDIKIATSKDGIGYAFWINNTPDENLLMCQKIVGGHFILEPEIICSIENYILGLKAVLNEKGDILVTYRDSKDNGNIITRIQNFWSKPFLFTSKEEDPRGLCAAIDTVGNMMVTCEIEINNVTVVKTIYKPVDQAWQNPILFSADNALSWNPQVQPDGAGNFVAIWQQEQRSRNVIFGRVFSTATQTWSDPQRLSSESESCFGPTYTFWAPGKGYIAWTMSPNGYDEVIQVAELSHE